MAQVRTVGEDDVPKRKKKASPAKAPRKRGGRGKSRAHSKEEEARRLVEQQQLFDECDIKADQNRPFLDCVRAGEELVAELNQENARLEQRVFGAGARAISEKEHEALQNEQRLLGEKLRLLGEQLRLLSARAQHTAHEYARAQLEGAFDPTLQAIAGGSFGNGCADF